MTPWEAPMLKGYALAALLQRLIINHPAHWGPYLTGRLWQWHLGIATQMQLLNISPREWLRLRMGALVEFSADTIRRAERLLEIVYRLAAFCDVDVELHWLTKTNAIQPFSNQRPIDLLRRGSFEAINSIHQYLETI